MKKLRSIAAFVLAGSMCVTPLTSYAQESVLAGKQGERAQTEAFTEGDVQKNVDQTAKEEQQEQKTTVKDTAEAEETAKGETEEAVKEETEAGEAAKEETKTEGTVKQENASEGEQAVPASKAAVQEEQKPKDEKESEVIQKVAPKLFVRAHIQNVGWKAYADGTKEPIGTTGKKQRMEAIQIQPQYDDSVKPESRYTGAVEYQVHVENKGWLGTEKNHRETGTTGESKRIEAIRINLTGELKEHFDIYYRMHVADFGWLGWTKNGQSAGTEGLARRVEAMELRLVAKEDQKNALSTTGRSFVRGLGKNDILFTTHIQNVGDTKETSIQNTVGTTGKKRRLEALRLRVSQPDPKIGLQGGIQYRTHIQNIGWQGWKSNGELSGTRGQSKRLEAVQIKLTGEIAKYYDIYYRAHVQNEGWLGWAKNGQSAGTAKMAYRMEALQIRLVLKGNAAPGQNANYYKEAKTGWYYEGGYKFYYIRGKKQLDLDGIIGRQSSYEIRVNRQACTVTVYAKDGNKGYIIPVKRFACSVGKAGSATPKGTFYTPAKYRWHTLMGPSYGQYCTRITGSVLFHSVAGRNMTSYNLNARDYNMLGKPASHGCVRLCVRDAKWIYDNCKLKTKVVIYDSGNPGPLGKPGTIKIPAGQTWDPTDPNVRR